jgi:biopolymer transport protein ExbD
MIYMPVKLNSNFKLEPAEARIEIIPLIDIMFFLLAAFMLVSLSMVNLWSVKVNLPAAKTAQRQNTRDSLDISVDQRGGVFLDKTPISAQRLAADLRSAKRSKPDVEIFISADRMSRHGDVMNVLDQVHAAGIDKVAFEVTPAQSGEKP